MSNNENDQCKQFIDVKWLAVFGLNKENVLEYFYMSDFYDSRSNNEIIRNQGVSVSHLSNMTGMEYSVDHENTKEPHLFVINKNLRRSPRDVELSEIFYCIDGIIYKSPCLLDLLRIRVSQVSFNLYSAFSELNSHVHYSSSHGHYLSVGAEAVVDSEVHCNSTSTIDNVIVKGAISSKHLPSFSQLLSSLKEDSHF